MNELARREGVTVFMLLLAAYKALLHRYTGEDDIVVGCPVAGRTCVETEGLIGFFVNTLVTRTDLSGDPTFGELLDRVRERALDAYANSDTPFEKLVDELGLERDLSRNPMFQTTFDVYTPQSSESRAAGVTFTPVRHERRTSPFDQAWSIAVTEAGLRVRVEYNTDLFDGDTIERMVDHWLLLLEGGVRQPGPAPVEVAAPDRAGAATAGSVERNDRGPSRPVRPRAV